MIETTGKRLGISDFGPRALELVRSEVEKIAADPDYVQITDDDSPDLKRIKLAIKDNPSLLESIMSNLADPMLRMMSSNPFVRMGAVVEVFNAGGFDRLAVEFLETL